MVRTAPNGGVSTMVCVVIPHGASVITPLVSANVLGTIFMMIALSQNVTKLAATMESATKTPKKVKFAFVIKEPASMAGWEKIVNYLSAKTNVTRFWGKEGALCMAVNVQMVSSVVTAPRKSVLCPKATSSCVLDMVTASKELVPVDRAGSERPVMPVHAPMTAVNEESALPMVHVSVNPDSKEGTAQNR